MKIICAIVLLYSGWLQAEDYTRFGYYRIVAVSPPVKIADPMANARIALLEAEEADRQGASVILFPELSLTGYTAEDLFLNDDLLMNTKKALLEITKQSSHLKVTLVVGAPYRDWNGRLYNTAFVISQGSIIGVIPKSHLPNYSEFYERRWFVPGGQIELDIKDPILGDFHLGTHQLFRLGEMIFGVEICEDVWAPSPPSTNLALAGANVILNLSASNELVGKSDYRKALIEQQSDRLLAGYVYASSGPTESTKDLVFGGHLMIFENGSKLSEGDRFKLEGEKITADLDVQKLLHERQRNITFGNQNIAEEFYLHEIPHDVVLSKLTRVYSKTPFVPVSSSELNSRAQEILSIQATGLARRLIAANAKTMIIGVSGGLDSTLALLVAQEAAKILNWDSSQIIGVTMPGFGTTNETKSSAIILMENLRISIKDISIVDAVNVHFKDIGQNPNMHDITYENAQARERTQILFDIANKESGIVVGTGDLSELCLGWCTYNGDHMSMYGVNSSIPKTLVKYIVGYIASQSKDPELRTVLEKILATEISPELVPPDAEGKILQVTEDIVGPYKLHDFFIYHYLRNGFGIEKIFTLATMSFADEFSPKVIQKWLRVFIQRYHQQQFKRTTLPSGPKVGSVSVSPRGDLRMPDEASYKALLDVIDNLPIDSSEESK
ncbi:MAG: NAD(+) synthase [Verrucomicrobia bacterium]|nr:NAD(+) synthase [Verrucomicrobiota bacterium]